MKVRTLRTRIIVAFFSVIAVVGLFTALLGYHVINKDIIDRTQAEVRRGLEAAHAYFYGEIFLIEQAFNLVDDYSDPEGFKQKVGLDYIRIVERKDRESNPSEIVRRAFFGIGLGGIRIIKEEELELLGPKLKERVQTPILDTPRARPSDKKILLDAMAIEFAKPLEIRDGKVEKVIYAGKIINRHYTLVDRMRDLVFENQSYNNRPTGTVTIFQDDVRITTNVLDTSSNRAVGTRVSSEVYNAVVKHRQMWVDRAFVVAEWYLTAYEPIMDIDGKIIGMLYVGLLEQPFLDMRWNILLAFIGVLVLAGFLAGGLSLLLSASIYRPVINLTQGTVRISQGALHHRIKNDSSVKELNRMARAFNRMAEKLDERQKSLEVSNQKLEGLNKSYLDLVSFVSHELKGILASTILNAYSVRDGFLGMINFKQRKALDSVARNLDYLEATVKNFLNLSRLEKGELAVTRQEIRLRDDVLNDVIDSFSKIMNEKNMRLENSVSGDARINADRDLLQIVLNNLVGNAVKYGLPEGIIRIDIQEREGRQEIEVYNEGRPLTGAETRKLFEKFTRLECPETRREKGTGLGLYIVRRIMEAHSGEIRIEPREQGNSFIITI